MSTETSSHLLAGARKDLWSLHQMDKKASLSKSLAASGAFPRHYDVQTSELKQELGTLGVKNQQKKTGLSPR